MEKEEVKVKKHEITPEEQAHLTAKDARVAAVKAAIEAARLIREEQEKLGTKETDGAKLDREAKEGKDLKAAEVVNKIEPFDVKFGSEDLNTLSSKVSEIVDYLNK